MCVCVCECVCVCVCWGGKERVEEMGGGKEVETGIDK